MLHTHSMRLGSIVAAGGGATAVTLDAVSELAVDTNATTWTSFNHVLASDANYVIGCVLCEQSTTVSVTFGGVTMNTDAGIQISSNGSAQWVFFFYLLAASLPTSGTKAVDVASTNATAFSGLARFWSFKGAKQEAPNSGSNRMDTDASSSAATSVVELTSVPAGSAVVSGHENNTNVMAGISGADVTASNNVPAGGGGHSCGAGHTMVGGSATTVTHTYTPNSTQRVASMMLELRPESP